MTQHLDRVQKADRVVAYSRYMGTVAEVNGVSPERLTVIPYPMIRTTGRPDYSLTTPGLVGYVGRLSKPKGVADLIRAVGQIDNIHLQIIGDGYQRAHLEELARRVVPGRYTFLGWASADELPGLYERASIIVMPGRWPEPFGLVGLEAGWAGRPVIASYSGGVPDWLIPGVTGIATEPGKVNALAQAIRTLTADPVLAGKMGRSARERLEHWPTDVDHATSMVDDVYAAILH